MVQSKTFELSGLDIWTIFALIIFLNLFFFCQTHTEDRKQRKIRNFMFSEIENVVSSMWAGARLLCILCCDCGCECKCECVCRLVVISLNCLKLNRYDRNSLQYHDTGFFNTTNGMFFGNNSTINIKTTVKVLLNFENVLPYKILDRVWSGLVWSLV